jgi:hypothetical protein
MQRKYGIEITKSIHDFDKLLRVYQHIYDKKLPYHDIIRIIMKEAQIEIKSTVTSPWSFEKEWFDGSTCFK